MFSVFSFRHGKRVFFSSPVVSRLVQFAARRVSGSAGDGGGYCSGPGGRDQGVEGHSQGPQEPLGRGWPGVGAGCPLHLRVVPPGLVSLYGACGAFLSSGPFPGLASEADLAGAALPVRSAGVSLGGLWLRMCGTAWTS
jgi:hypothetical protein